MTYPSLPRASRKPRKKPLTYSQWVAKQAAIDLLRWWCKQGMRGPYTNERADRDWQTWRYAYAPEPPVEPHIPQGPQIGWQLVRAAGYENWRDNGRQ